LRILRGVPIDTNRCNINHHVLSTRYGHKDKHVLNCLSISFNLIPSVRNSCWYT